MKTVAISVLLCGAIMTHLVSGSSQQCYICRGFEESCANPDVSALEKKTCTTSCMTLTFENGDVRRGCSVMRGTPRCDYLEGFMFDSYICYCNSELCNDEPAPQFSRRNLPEDVDNLFSKRNKVIDDID